MAKILRKTQKIFAVNAVSGDVVEFGSIADGAFIATTDLDAIQNVDWEVGLRAGVVASGKRLPTLEDFNSMSFVETTQLAYIMQEGIAEFDLATEYHVGSIVKRTGTFELYGSLVTPNLGNALPAQVTDANWHFLGVLGGGVEESGNNDFTGNNTFSGKTSFKDAGELTIAAGVITITGTSHTVDTEADAATDDLDTINTAADGDIVVLRAQNAARTVVIKHNTGNIFTNDLADITLDETEKVVVLQFDLELAKWLVLSQPTSGVSDASETEKGVVELATDAEILAETATGGTGAALVISNDKLGESQRTCKAWVNFNGTGVVSIRGSFNVSSVTDLGTGNYRINFSLPMPNANYCISGLVSLLSGADNMDQITAIRRNSPNPLLTTSANVITGSAGSLVLLDMPLATYMVMGD